MTAREARQLEALTDRMDEEGAAEPPGMDEDGAAVAPTANTTRLAYGTVSDKKFSSKRKKEANALKHFQCYLKKRGIQTLPKDIPVAEIDHDLMGGFLKYMEQCLLDPRTFLSSYNALAVATASIHRK
jgi:hypothetical protein